MSSDPALARQDSTGEDISKYDFEAEKPSESQVKKICVPNADVYPDRLYVNEEVRVEEFTDTSVIVLLAGHGNKIVKVSNKKPLVIWWDHPDPVDLNNIAHVTLISRLIKATIPSVTLSIVGTNNTVEI